MDKIAERRRMWELQEEEILKKTINIKSYLGKKEMANIPLGVFHCLYNIYLCIRFLCGNTRIPTTVVDWWVYRHDSF